MPTRPCRLHPIRASHVAGATTGARPTGVARRTRHPRRRRAAIQSSATRSVLTPVLKHVHERVTHLARRPQVPRGIVISRCPEATMSLRGAAQPASPAYGERTLEPEETALAGETAAVAAD